MFLRLTTRDPVRPDHYTISRAHNKAPFVLRTGDLTVSKPTLTTLLFTLGGMVEWSVWSENSRAALAHLNDGKEI